MHFHPQFLMCVTCNHTHIDTFIDTKKKLIRNTWWVRVQQLELRRKKNTNTLKSRVRREVVRFEGRLGCRVNAIKLFIFCHMRTICFNKMLVFGEKINFVCTKCMQAKILSEIFAFLSYKLWWSQLNWN